MAEIILGYKVISRSERECVDDIYESILNSLVKKYLVCINPHSISVARNDNYFENALSNASIVLPDGIGIVWASKLLGGDIKKRITGMDIFLGLSEVLNSNQSYKYYFLGSTDEVLNKIRKRMSTEFPNINVVGTYSPPFKDKLNFEDNKKIINDINIIKPHVLWVGMTAPKQEKWIYENIGELDVNFVGAIGAVFDFYAGTKKRSGKWYRDKGLEWLPRLMREPGRLWRRVIISGPLFMYYVLKQRLYMTFNKS